MSSSLIYDLGKSGLQDLLDNSCSYAEVFDKLGMSRHGNNYDTLRKYIELFDINLDRINENRKELNKSQLKELHKRTEIPLEDIICENSDIKYKGTTLKTRLLKANLKEYRCESCGLTEWLGKPIPLQLHHIDGNHDNNQLNNLQLLCPNCHSMTDTYAGKNVNRNKKIQINGIIANDGRKELCPVCKKNYKTKSSDMCRECFNESIKVDIDRDELKREIRNYSFLEVGRRHSVTDNAIRKRCISVGLPTKKREINKMTDEEWASV